MSRVDLERITEGEVDNPAFVRLSCHFVGDSWSRSGLLLPPMSAHLGRAAVRVHPAGERVIFAAAWSSPQTNLGQVGDVFLKAPSPLRDSNPQPLHYK